MAGIMQLTRASEQQRRFLEVYPNIPSAIHPSRPAVGGAMGMVGCRKMRTIYWALFPAKKRAPRWAAPKIRVGEQFCAVSGMFILVYHHGAAQHALERHWPASRGWYIMCPPRIKALWTYPLSWVTSHNSYITRAYTGVLTTETQTPSTAFTLNCRRHVLIHVEFGTYFSNFGWFCRSRDPLTFHLRWARSPLLRNAHRSWNLLLLSLLLFLPHRP